MRILLVCHYFAPEPGAPQTRLSTFAKLWALEGNDVTVLTAFPNHPTGVIHPGYEKRKRMVTEQDGYRIVRTWLYATPNEGVVRKTLSHISWMVSSVLLGLRKVGPADVVVVSSPTFFSMLSAWFIAKVKRAAFVVEIRDLWPAAIIDLGVLTNRTVIRILEWFELFMYRAADAVVPTSNGFKRSMTDRGIDGEKICVITNSVDLDRFTEVGNDRRVTRKQLGVAADDVMLVLYAGTIGSVYALPQIADVARELAGERMHFTFVGEGVAKPALVAAAAGLENVTILPAVPPDDVPALIDACDVGLIPYRDIKMLDVVIAAKMFEYMAARKPVVGSVAGETADILKASGAIVVKPEDADAIADALRSLLHDASLRTTIGSAERSFVEKNYDIRVLASRYLDLLAGVVR